MAGKKTLLAGMAIGAGATLGVRQAIRRFRAHAERSRRTGLVLEPEDSRTRSYVPNTESNDWITERRTGPKDRRAEISIARGAPGEDQQHSIPGDQRRSQPEGGGGFEPGPHTGRSNTRPEAELRSHPEGPEGPVGVPGEPPAPGTVNVSHDPEDEPAQGGKPPGINENK